MHELHGIVIDSSKMNMKHSDCVANALPLSSLGVVDLLWGDILCDDPP